MTTYLFSPSYPKPFVEPTQGVTDQTIAFGKPGRVRYRGTYWKARLYHPNQRTTIQPGDPVRILAMQGITLLVTPAC
ncbi:MAG: hypothetical protein HC865_26040 [Cyanobacteria bacterium RU_5_0]|nr:hypothetical protein [Cyanobacteria bacterium RU_5_0]